jgi:SagB-type dehydrogenase family enzyme
MKSKSNNSPIINLNALLDNPQTYSEKFHEATKNKEIATDLSLEEWPEEWKKEYVKGYSRLPEIFLPKPHLPAKFSLRQALLERSSERNFSDKSLALKPVSNLLYYSAGMRNIISPGTNSRFYPSAGARYPLELYLLSFNTSLQKGLYHYYLKSHSLELLLPLEQFAFEKYFSQAWVAQTASIILITAVFKRNTMKYGDRGYRLIMNEVGHLSQNLYLVSTALNLACSTVTGFKDKLLDDLLDVDGINESIVSAFAFGDKHA